MLEQGGGAIANTASLVGMRVNHEFASAPYHAAKAGVIHITRVAAVAYATSGIRVNAVAPAVTLTERISLVWTPQRQAAMVKFSPMLRPMTPVEIAAAFVWAWSPEASAVTGVIVPVDGGWSAQ